MHLTLSPLCDSKQWADCHSQSIQSNTPWQQLTVRVEASAPLFQHDNHLVGCHSRITCGYISPWQLSVITAESHVTIFQQYKSPGWFSCLYGRVPQSTHLQSTVNEQSWAFCTSKYSGELSATKLDYTEVHLPSWFQFSQTWTEFITHILLWWKYSTELLVNVAVLGALPIHQCHQLADIILLVFLPSRMQPVHSSHTVETLPSHNSPASKALPARSNTQKPSPLCWHTC